MTVADTVEAQEAMHQDLQATRVEAAFNTGDEIVEAVFDQSGQRLAAFTRDDVLKVWQAPYGSDPITTIASNERIVSLAFNPDGQQLATGTEEGLVTIWNVTTGEQVKSLSGLTKWVMALAFSPDGTLLAVSDQAGQVTGLEFY
jgi:WD40 repeat protein